MPGRIEAGSNRREGDGIQGTEGIGIASRDFTPAAEIFVQFFQLRNTQGTVNIREAIVETQEHHFVLPLAVSLALPSITRYAVIPETPQRLREIRAIGGDHTAFGSGKVLYGMKAEDGHIRDAADPPILIFRSKFGSQGVRGVFDHN